MSLPMCLICKADFPWPPDEEDLPYYQKWPDEDRVGVGVCPTCRRHAEIGKRVEGMKPAKYPEGEGADMRYEEIDQADGYNRCLREAKGEKP